MKKSALLLILVFALTLLSNCDGREKAHRTAQKDLVENKVLKAFNQHITYIPETYFETTTDTIFSNGYSVFTKFYSSRDAGVLLTENITKKTSKTFYRNILVDIKVLKNNNEIFNNTINSSFLIREKLFNTTEAADYIVADYWLENIDKNNGIPVLLLNYKNVKSKNTRLFRFSFLEEGLTIEKVI